MVMSLVSILLLFLWNGWHTDMTSVVFTVSDSVTVERLLRVGSKERGDENRMVYYGRKFAGIPYVAHTLEKGDEERLIVNLRQMDCTTFVEYVVALSVCDMKGQKSFVDFCNNLARIRYRHGVVDGYASRLHYFTWWGEENERKKIVKEIVSDGPPFTAVQTIHIDYMSRHPSLYKRLKADARLVPVIREYEKETDGKKYRYIPKSLLGGTPKQLGNVHSGDIVSIITGKEGLDTSHVGIAVWQNGRLHLMHASSLRKKVVLDEKTFYDYSMQQKSQLGIRVYRLME